MEQLNYQNVGGSKPVAPVQDNKTLAIISLVLSIVCCNILSIVFAIIGLVKANDVSKYLGMGQEQMALSASKNAKIFSWVAIGLLVLGLVINVIFIVAVGGMEGYQQMLEQMMN